MGDLRIAQKDEWLEAPIYRTHSLLAYLLLNPRPIQRESLIATLFPEETGKKGRSRLSDRLWKLREALPDLPLQSSSEVIHLPKDERWLDVEFLVEAGQDGNVDQMPVAAELYRDELLPAIYEDWIVTDRENVRLAYIGLLGKLSEQLIRKQDFVSAEPILRRIAQAEPLDEKAVRNLMGVYRRLGQRGAALNIYEQFSHTLAEEMQLEPEAATVALADSIRAAVPGQLKVEPIEGDPINRDALMRRAQTALEKGERDVFVSTIKQLNAIGSDETDLDVKLLEIDGAVLFGDYNTAEQVLNKLDAASYRIQARQAYLLLRQRKSKQAYDLGTQALLEAHEQADKQTELYVLLILSEVEMDLGKMAEAKTNAATAQRLANELKDIYSAARALLLQGRRSVRMGSYTGALQNLHEAESLAEENGFRPILLETAFDLSQSYGAPGNLKRQQEYMQRCLNLARDLGMQQREASILMLMAYVYDQMKRKRESFQVQEQARAILTRLEDEFGLAKTLYSLSFSISWHDETRIEEAIEMGWQAIEIFKKYETPGWLASTTYALGTYYWIAGDPERAIDLYDRSYKQHAELGELGWLTEILTYKAAAILDLGRLDEALAVSNQAVLEVARGKLEADYIFLVYLVHGWVLLELGQEGDAEKNLKRGYNKLLDLAKQNADEEAREGFFSAMPLTRRAMKILYAQGIAEAPQKVSLSNAVAEDGALWTVDAGPPDKALKRAEGAVALRRNRLARLLKESRRQKSPLTVKQMADLLGVSKRTVQRDLIRLRSETK
ncbi:MAG: HTH domain-containing protein [Chloroflexi bacterium]|nr:HTH domain-containing protein [Chloroflexota bacterium]